MYHINRLRLHSDCAGNLAASWLGQQVFLTEVDVDTAVAELTCTTADTVLGQIVEFRRSFFTEFDPT